MWFEPTAQIFMALHDHINRFHCISQYSLDLEIQGYQKLCSGKICCVFSITVCFFSVYYFHQPRVCIRHSHVTDLSVTGAGIYQVARKAAPGSLLYQCRVFQSSTNHSINHTGWRMTRWPTSGMMGSIHTKTILEENLFSTVTAVTHPIPTRRGLKL